MRNLFAAILAAVTLVASTGVEAFTEVIPEVTYISEVAPEMEEATPTLTPEELGFTTCTTIDGGQCYTHSGLAVADAPTAIEELWGQLHAFEAWLLEQDGVVDLMVFQSFKLDTFLQRNVAVVIVDCICDTTKDFSVELVFPLVWENQKMPYCSTYTRTSYGAEELETDYIKNVFKFETSECSLSEVEEDFEAVMEQLRGFLPERVGAEVVMHDVMHDYQGEGTGLYMVLIEFIRSDKTLEYMEVQLPFCY